MKTKISLYAIILIITVNTIHVNAYTVPTTSPQTLLYKAEELKNTITETYKWLQDFYEKSNREYVKFEITAYDLGFKSCNKTNKHPDYGMTYTDFSLKGKSVKNGDRYIAVDSKVIPLGSYVEIIFDKSLGEAYNVYTGVYKAVDIGGNIKGNRIDLFIGDFNQRESSQEAIDFGRVDADVFVIGKGE